MRCPYCGGFNPDNATFCKRCGRNVGVLPSNPAAQQRPAVPYPSRQGPPNNSQRPPAVQPTPPRQTGRPNAQPKLPVTPTIPQPVAPPEPPVPFPPKTVQQLNALKQSALPFAVVSESISNKRKRIVRISYGECTNWQQVATLCQALEKLQSATFETIVIQGVLSSDTDTYAFTNGQLVFDRDVRLGSQVLQRYQIETGNGFAADTQRIVLAE